MFRKSSDSSADEDINVESSWYHRFLVCLPLNVIFPSQSSGVFLMIHSAYIFISHMLHYCRTGSLVLGLCAMEFPSHHEFATCVARWHSIKHVDIFYGTCLPLCLQVMLPTDPGNLLGLFNYMRQLLLLSNYPFLHISCPSVGIQHGSHFLAVFHSMFFTHSLFSWFLLTIFDLPIPRLHF